MPPDLWSLYALMLKSRLFEEAIAKLWHDGLTPDVNSGHETFFMLQPALHRTAAHRQPGIGTPAALAVFADCRIPRCIP